MTKLELHKTKPHQPLVEMLKDLLTQAENGKLLAFALIGETGNNQTIEGHSIQPGRTNLMALVGGLELLKRRLIDLYIEE